MRPDDPDGADSRSNRGDEGESHSRLYGRIRALAAEARREREGFDPPADPPDEDRALACCRDGLGPVVAAYVEARTGERARLSPTEMRLLDRATDDWLELYARCYGVEMDAEFTVREAAELLVDTRDVRDVAALLTRVPGR